jgi:hypothetical protein
MKEGIEDIKSEALSSVESTRNPELYPYPEKWENKYPPITSLQPLNKYPATSLVPWSNEEIKTATVVYSLTPGLEWTPQIASAFSAGIRCREKPDTPKPFPAPGAWFPVDILGNPMRQTSPGKWESLTGISSQLVLRITTAYEQGVGQANRTELKNPYSVGSLECEAWDLGREHILSQDKNTPIGFGCGGETTQYNLNKQSTK